MKTSTFTLLVLTFLVSTFSFTVSAQELPAENSATPVEEAVTKPYERFKLNIDTVTNLVTYKSIVDQMETDADSFYIRAKKWADRKYRLASNKKIVLLDKPNEKLVLKAKFDAYTSFNKYNKNMVGDIYFNLTIIFKENKYKYIIDNITYVPFQDPEAIKKGTPAEDVTSFEYLAVKKFKIKQTDNLLKCTDQEFNNLIADIQKSLKNPNQADEDEF